MAKKASIKPKTIKKLKKQKVESFFSERDSVEEKALSLIESEEINRADAIFLIQDYLGLNLKEFCLKYDLNHQYFYECLKAKRPFLKDAQDKLRDAVMLHSKGLKVTIAFE